MPNNLDRTAPLADLKSWKILNVLSKQLITEISMVYVYGKTSNSVLFITTDDTVYAVGNNTCGCLGTGDELNTLIPVKVNQLCGMGITTFAHGHSPHVLALTSVGQVYSWGNNQYFQLGHVSGFSYENVSCSPVCTPHLLSKSDMSRVVQISCGTHSSVVLTDTGTIFAWGNVCTSYHPQSYNSKKEYHFSESNLFTHIACGASFFVAFDKIGRLYTWGSITGSTTESGQKAIQNSSLCNFTIAKIVCGCNHTLALTSMGVLYVWGSNSAGQLGLDNKRSVSSPNRLTKMDKIYDIATSNNSDISVAMAEGNQIFVWGMCYGISVYEPMLTSFKHMYDALASCSTYPSMHHPLVIYQNNEMCILEALKQAFNDPATSDFIVVVEKKRIYVHKVILKLRSDYFKIMLENNWKETDERCIEHNQFCYDVYLAFLKYLYTEDIDLPLEDTVELLCLAHLYVQENLKNLCAFKIKQAITISNVCRIYHVAVDFNIEELEDWSLKFILTNLTEVVKSKDFFLLSDYNLKQIMLTAAEASIFLT